MLLRTRAVAAFAFLCFVGPALAQETPPEGPPAAPDASPTPDAPPPAATATCAPKRKGPGLGALLAAANQAGAGDLLTGRSGGMFGAGKHGSIAGGLLGGVINAAGTQQAAAGDYGAAPTGAYGGRKAQAAAVAAGTVVALARAQASAKAAPCGG